jgi:hypothetical protein
MHSVAIEQGLITEEGYKVEGENYRAMGEAARMAADAENKAADRAPWLAAIHGAAAVASLFDLGGGGPAGPITLGGPKGPTPFY